MKSILDTVISFLGLLILMPLLILISLMLLFSIGTPFIFKQKRPGYKSEQFYFYKFRTMTNKKDKNGNLLSDGERLTSFGEFLRKTSLDELPSLWNVLKGDMSLVGRDHC